MKPTNNSAIHRVSQFFKDLNPRKKAKSTDQMKYDVRERHNRIHGETTHEYNVIFKAAATENLQHEFTIKGTIKGMAPSDYMKKYHMGTWVREGLATPPPEFAHASSSRQPQPVVSAEPAASPPDYNSGAPVYGTQDRILETSSGIVMGEDPNVQAPMFLINSAEAREAIRGFNQLHSEFSERVKMRNALEVLALDLQNVSTKNSGLKRAIDKQKFKIVEAVNYRVNFPLSEGDITLTPLLEGSGSLGLEAIGHRLPQNWTIANFNEALAQYRTRHKNYDDLLRKGYTITNEILDISPNFREFVTRDRG